jgi:hypothetical protein
MVFTYSVKGLKRIVPNTIFTFVLAFTLFTVSYGQDTREEAPPLKERIFVGGSFGLQLGTITDIQVSPVVGIWLLPRLAVAVGPDYRFYKFQKIRTNVYGGKAYAQFVIIKNINSFIPLGVNTGIFFHIEDELLSLEKAYWKDQYATGRFYLNTVLAGGGISQQIGRRSSLNFIVLWALNDSGYGVYSNPEIRVSFNF